jgi:hypothetical protein
MKFKYAGLFSFALVLLAFSCSIIQDSDIKSAAEVSNLKLTSIKLDQATQAGGTTTATITPVVDKVVNISTAAGLLTRYIEFNAPVFSATSKVKYKTAVADGARMYIYYFSTGKPSTFGIYKENIVNGKVKDSTFYEVYRFRYDASGRMNKFVTFLNPTAAATSNDTLVFGNANQVTSILRRTNPAQTITVQYQDGVVTNLSVAPSTNLSSPTKTISYGGNACTSCADEFTSSLGYNQGGNGGGNSGGTPITITLVGLPGKPQTIFLENPLNVGYAPDTYYFHPLMLLCGQVPQGNALLHIYLIDWWQLGAGGGSTGNNSFTEKVKFTFNYVKQ